MNPIFEKDRLKQECQTMLPDLIRMRRTLHMHPELGTEEHETDRLIIGFLEEAGIPYEFPVADTGIAATVTGKAPAKLKKRIPVIGVRADIDALPLQEDTARPYTSKNPGVMHACGHDAHAAIALGVAKYLKEHEEEWTGTVRFFFQPAEETCGGAKRMIDEGCMKRPPVQYMIGVHMMPTHEYGMIETKYGALNASSDELTVRLHGVSSHCAYPDAGVDAIVMAAAVIQSLQSVVSRSSSPFQPVVLSFGTIQGGTAQNVVADAAELHGTLRTTDPETRNKLLSRIQTIVEETAKAYGGTGELIRKPGYDALINNDEIVDAILETVKERLGEGHIILKPQPSLGVEDFSFFLDHAQGAFYHLGCANAEKGITAPLHNRNFDIDERVLALGCELQLALIEKLQGK